MDLFIYKVKVKELEICPTVSRLEELTREYAEISYNTNLAKFPSYASKYTFEQEVMYYKLFTLALKMFAKKSKRILPEFIYKRQRNIQHELLSSILCCTPDDITEERSRFNYMPTYKHLMDWFEFDDILILPRATNNVECLNSIIGSNPIHFEIDFGNRLTNFDKFSTNFTLKQQLLIYTIRYKQVNFPTEAQTVWDLYMDYLIERIDTPAPSIDEQVLKLEQHITAIKSIGDYIGK